MINRRQERGEGGRPGNVRERMRAGEEDNIMRMIIKITMKRSEKR